MQYMTSSDALAASGDLLLDVSLSPSEFLDFPCGKVVPAKTTVRMLGLVGNPFFDGSGASTGCYTEFVKLVKDRETLFDIDRAGIPFKGQYGGMMISPYIPEFSLIGGVWQQPPYAQAVTGDSVNNGKPLMFEPPLEFVSGEELLVKLTCFFEDGFEIAVADIDLAAILHVKVE